MTGAIVTGSGFVKPLAQSGGFDFIEVATLLSNGSGSLVLPSPSRVQVNGGVHLAHSPSATPPAADCGMAIATIPGPDEQAIVGPIPTQLTQILTVMPLVGFADVPAGTYNLRVLCRSADPSDAAVAVRVMVSAAPL